MTKEIIESEIERLFPQFNHAEIVAAVMAAEWMQDYKNKVDEEKLDKLAEEYLENIPLEDLYKAVKKDNPNGLMKLIYKTAYRKAKEG